MKKKIVFFVMLIMCTAAVSAQKWSITPEIGMTAIKSGGGSSPYQQQWSARYKVGVGVEYVVKPGFFSLKSGLYYTERGLSSAYTTYGNWYGQPAEKPEIGTIQYKKNRHFLQLPVLANFSFKLSESARINLGVGPYIAYSLGDKHFSDFMYYAPNENEEGGHDGGFTGTGASIESWSHDNPFDWGISFQAGVEVQQYVMNFGYEASLGKEFKGGPIDMKYNTFSLSVGYKFNLGK